MSTLSLAGFLCIVAVGSYFQAFTGFALGIFVLGAVVLLHIAGIGTTAIAINIMTLVNTTFALRGNFRRLNRRLYVWTLFGIIPGVPIGIWLLDVLSSRSANFLQFALGAIVLLAGAMLCVRPETRHIPSRWSSFVLAGGIGGVLGGMFSVPGPPIIYQFYVQPLAIEQVRFTLLGIFGTISLMRVIILTANGTVGLDSIYLGFLSIPVVAITTVLCIRFPPQFSEFAVRRIAFLLLSAMGLFIVAMGLT